MVVWQTFSLGARGLAGWGASGARKDPMNLQFIPLEGAHVRLEPVRAEDRDELRATLDCDPEGWEIMSVNGCGEGFDDWWGEMIGQSQRGERLCYLIRRQDDNSCIGTSSY